MNTLPLSEAFGPVWQGEGPFTGRTCWFIRLGLCNLHCSWCDTPFTWDHTRFDVAAECPETTVADILALLPTPPPPLVILSGGEPMMHQRKPAFVELLANLNSAGVAVHVETNGTLAPTEAVADRVEHFIVSPKVAQTDDPHSKRIKPRALAAFAALALTGQASFKFVITTEAEAAEAAALCDEHHVPHSARWAMPEGITPDTVLAHARTLAPIAAAHGFNLSLRQQTLMFGNTRAT